MDQTSLDDVFRVLGQHAFALSRLQMMNGQLQHALAEMAGQVQERDARIEDLTGHRLVHFPAKEQSDA